MTSIGVDCLRLAYCRSGDGTAIISNAGNTPQALAGRLWRTLDDDHDGFLDIPASPSQPDVFSLQIQPNAPTADIAPGDTYQFHMRTAGGDVVLPTTLSGYFVTTPAVATLNGQAVIYPVTNATLGSQTNPVRMTGDALSVTLWRPQRAALPGESGDLTDQGHLHYAVNVHNATNTMELACAGDYTGLSPTLRVASGGDPAAQLFPLTDTADDAPPSSANTMSFTFDLGGCMRRNGIDPNGQLVPLPIMAVGESRPGGVDRTSQLVYVCFPGCTVPTMPGPPGP